MIPLFSKPKVISEKENQAVFEIESLYPGYGVTIGNSLRRVLLSSLPGAAITKMKIKGVPHEFSTIPGVFEDVIQIMLNLKKLRFKVFSEEPQQAILKAKGETDAKGKDFQMSSQLELINKNEHIASLTDKKADLEIEIEVEKGIGYIPREDRKRGKLGIGEILLDAIYTPVKRVGYQVESMRVGERTDFDKLVMEVQTDGTISPQMAVSQAAQILLDHFSLINQSFVESEEKPKAQKVVKTKTKKTIKVKKIKSKKK
ncbi:MAG: DNA-directed RNA polymerase subunit alpha [Parcubacteria group bacterium CG_4_10_14_0_2_um_filter_7_35_8]|nr:MAG: DNA-directed RNA polymerase subunit alpha [Parcubacteria group bacterium CG10_big_fil_rev_8_21_14_0_10_35_15]PIZ77034.1 MAG: DNA-directed RNA polymerase subunit alpha [Parcubacteria group bacterium CG_4_10_14_0_2_um_filter_7_35_8]